MRSLNQSDLLRFGTQDSRDDAGHAIPFFGFLMESALPCHCQTVVLGFAVVFRLTHSLMIHP